jgi:excisionase family DNA binding protein
MPKKKTTPKRTEKLDDFARDAGAQVYGAERDLITFEDAAQMLGTSRRTIERLCKRGELKTYKRAIGVGRGRRPRLLDRAEVVALKERVEVVSA